MSGNVAVNRETGEVLVISPEGEWRPAQRARNPQTGQEVYFDGNGWQDVPRRQRSMGEEAVRRLGMGIRDVGQGLGMVPGLAYDAAAAPINLATRGINALTGAEIPQIRSASQNIDALSDAAGLARPETREERVISAINRNTAAVLPTLGAGIAARGAAGVTQAFNPARSAVADLALQAPTQLAAGAVSGAVEGATDSPLAGLAAGLAVPVVGAGLSRLATPIRTPQSPERAALVAAAEREGIPLTAGQATGSPFLQRVERQLEQMRFTGPRQQAVMEEQQRAFNRAVLSRSGTQADVATPEVLEATRGRIGSVFDDLTRRNDVRIDEEALSALANLDGRIRSQYISSLSEPALNRLNEAFRIAHENGGIIPGALYRQIDSDIGKQMRATTTGDLRSALGEVRDTLRTLMDRSISPADSTAWDLARRQYANYIVTRDAMGGAGAAAATGNVPALGLRQPLNRSTGGGYASGRGDLNELARIGQAILRPPSSSGTAENRAAQEALTLGALLKSGGTLGTLGGIVAGTPGAIGGAALGMARAGAPSLIQILMNTQAGQRYLRNQPSSIPAINARLLAEILAQRGDHAPPTLPDPRRN